jgi:hypothetical protein
MGHGMRMNPKYSLRVGKLVNQYLAHYVTSVADRANFQSLHKQDVINEGGLALSVAMKWYSTGEELTNGSNIPQLCQHL